MKVREAVQLGKVGLDKAGDLVAAAEGSELGEPYRLAVADLVDRLEVVKEGGGGVGRGVPVGDAEVVSAAGGVASGNPRLEPVETLAGDVAVGDGRGTDLDLASVAVEVLDVSSGSGAGVQVALSGVVTLVEAQTLKDR